MNKLLIDRAQTLSSEKKLFGRANIGAFSSEGVADEFSTESDYSVGQLVTYQTELYRCKTAVTAGAWDSTKWEKIKVVDAFKLSFATYGTTTYAAVKAELDAGKIVFLNHTLTGGEVVILSTSGYKEVSGTGFIDFLGIRSGNVSSEDLIYRTRLSSNNNTWSEVTSGPLGGDITQVDLGNIVASIHDSSASYTKGQYVIYNKGLYRCKSATSGQWDGTKWDSTHSTDVFSGSVPGLVPAAESGDADKVLKGDGTWGEAGSSVRVSYDAQTEELHMDFSPHPNEVLIGGRWYPYVQIGNQLWLAENLDYIWSGLTVGSSGTSSSESRANYYNNDESTYGVNGNKQGLLYNHYAATNIPDLPVGWHLPSKSEWETLITYVGDSPCTKLRAYSFGGSDDYDMSVLPTGLYTGNFSSETIGYYWTDTFPFSGSYYYINFGNSPNVSYSQYSESYEMGIRLVKTLT